MLDGKILVAVLVTLAAVSTGMNGGSVNAQEIKQNTQEITSSNSDINFGNLISSPISEVRSFFETTPEPTNEVTAELEVEDLKSNPINVKSASMEAENFTSLQMGSKKVTSDEKLQLYGYTGSINPGTVSELKGRADGFVSSGVNVSGIMSIQEEISSRQFTFSNVERSSLTFSSVTGEINSANASAEFGSARPLEINSFSGEIMLIPENNTLRLDGKVDRLEAGSFSFGG